MTTILLKKLGLSPKEIRRYKNKKYKCLDYWKNESVLDGYTLVQEDGYDGYDEDLEIYWSDDYFVYRKDDKLIIRHDNYMTGGGTDRDLYIFE